MDRQCSSCGGFCKKSGCERENIKPKTEKQKRSHLHTTTGKHMNEYIEKIRFQVRNRELIKLGLSTRVVNALQQVGVTTFDLLLQVTVKELQKNVPDLGKKGVDSILALVSSKGFKLVGQDVYEQKQWRINPKRKWVGLTDEDDIDWEEGGNLKDLVKAIETKLKEKNT